MDIAADRLEDGPFRTVVRDTAYDWSYAAWVYGTARAESHLASAEQARQLAIGIMVEGIAAGVFVAGEVEGTHQPWMATPAQAIERIVDAWPVELELTPGEVTWLDLTPLGEELASGLEQVSERESKEPLATRGDVDLMEVTRWALGASPVAACELYDIAAATGVRTGSEVRQLCLGIVADLVHEGEAVVGDLTEAGFRAWGTGLGDSLVQLSERWTRWGPTRPEPTKLFGLESIEDPE